MVQEPITLSEENVSSVDAGRHAGQNGEWPAQISVVMPTTLEEMIRETLLSANESGSREIPNAKRDTLQTNFPEFESALEFVTGYISGLGDFIIERNLNILIGDTAISPHILHTGGGREGFLQGLGLKQPREFPQQSIDDIYNRLNENSWKYIPTSSNLRQLTTASDMLYQNGYRLGFVVGIAKKHGVALPASKVPLTTAAYTAFMDGLAGKARQMTFTTLSSLTKDKVLSNIWENYSSFFSERQDTHSAELSYMNGLRVWLESMGLGPSNAELLRHPDSLSAFHAGLRGEYVAVQQNSAHPSEDNIISYTPYTSNTSPISMQRDGPAVLQAYGLGLTVHERKQREGRQ